jgi:geranylgeranylglycerol-phosphate geranylgeranyltransferase
VKYIASFIALSRPVNGLITALSVGVGALCTNGSINTVPLLKAALSAVLINGAGNAFNDLIDIDIDRVNRPERPLPSGRITSREAAVFVSFLTVCGSLLALALSPLHGLFATAIVALLAIYSVYLKNSILWGNILIGIIGAAAFAYGALAAGSLGRAWIPATLAFLFHLGREIIKDIEDIEGDSLRGKGTLPLRWGTRRAAHLATAIYLLLILFTLIPFVVGIYAEAYLLCVSLVDLLVLYTLYRLYREKMDLRHDVLGRLLKFGMLLGLLAVVIGEWRRAL